MFLFLLLAVPAGCSKKPATEGRNAAGSTTGSGALTSTNDLIATLSEENEAILAERKEALAALAKKDYAGLDAMAAEFRTNATPFASGRTRLSCFYQGLRDVDDESPDNAWEAGIAAINEWVTNRPASITARLALASFWLDYAYKARGTDVADKVTDQGWKLFKERTAKASAVLEAAVKLQEKCPRFWFLAQELALHEGYSIDDYNKIFSTAVRNYPGVSQYYFSKAYYVLPRWYGKEGDWEAFANESADKIGGDEGDILYARIVWNMRQRHVYGNIYQESKASWKRANRGFALLHQRFPDSISLKSEYCLEASLNDDKEVVKKLMLELGYRYVDSIWDFPDRFAATRDWALEK
jgi:hypothetical protein